MRNNSVPKFIFRLSRFPVYRGSVLDRFYCTNIFNRQTFISKLFETLKHFSIYNDVIKLSISMHCRRPSVPATVGLSNEEDHEKYNIQLSLDISQRF